MPPTDPTGGDESFAASVHRVAGVGQAGRGLLLERLAQHFEATASGEAATAGLVEVLNNGDEPSVLLSLILPRVPLLHPYRHQKQADWRWGTYSRRLALIDELYSTARSVGAEQRRKAEYARAALLLAVQERFLTGPAPAIRLIQEADFASLTQWPPTITAQLKTLADAKSGRTASFSNAVISATEELQRVFTDSAGRISGPQHDAVVASLELMALRARHRPDVQWRLANFVWRLANLARSAGTSELLDRLRRSTLAWSRRVGDAVFDRWLEEALTEETTIKTPGLTLVSAGEASGRIRLQKSES